MAEPENHALRLLREFREEFRACRAEFGEFRAVTEERLGELARVFAGETVLSRYAAADVEKRLSAVEKRLAALEKAR
jgi:hypothetical protein